MIKILSDLHHDYTNYQRNFLPEDKDFGLILAGDIFHNFNTINQLDMERYCQNFKWVIYVLGNHDYEGSSIKKRIYDWKEFSKKFNNLHILENESIILDDIRFIGATLWTNYFNKNFLSMQIAQSCMPEFSLIYIEDGNLIYPEYIYDLHIASKHYLEIELSQPCNLKTVVISHHLPHRNSVDKKFEYDQLNPAFYSDLSNIFLDYNFDYWIHGHTHSSCDYVFNNKRVICNPRGYGMNPQNNQFNENFILEI